LKNLVFYSLDISRLQWVNNTREDFMPRLLLVHAQQERVRQHSTCCVRTHHGAGPCRVAAPDLIIYVTIVSLPSHTLHSSRSRFCIAFLSARGQLGPGSFKGLFVVRRRAIRNASERLIRTGYPNRSCRNFAGSSLEWPSFLLVAGDNAELCWPECCGAALYESFSVIMAV
jgi:hypothetical protein